MDATAIVDEINAFNGMAGNHGFPCMMNSVAKTICHKIRNQRVMGLTEVSHTNACLTESAFSVPKKSIVNAAIV